jgi:hypothetical protein
MIPKFLSLYLVCLTFFQTQFSAIYKTDTHRALLSYIDKDTVVIFDIDETLIFLRSMLYHPQARKIRAQLHHQVMAREDADMVLSRVFKTIDVGLIEPDVVNLIQEITPQSAAVMACTARSSKSLGISLTQHISQQLNQLGISFTLGSFINGVIADATCEHDDCHPEFYESILFTQGREKGPALLLFFKTMQFVPRKVVFVDDLYTNIVSVHESLSQAGIPCTCFHYQRPPPYLPWQEEVILHQIEHFHKTGHWLKDEEAKKVVKPRYEKEDYQIVE